MTQAELERMAEEYLNSKDQMGTEMRYSHPKEIFLAGAQAVLKLYQGFDVRSCACGKYEKIIVALRAENERLKASVESLTKQVKRIPTTNLDWLECYKEQCKLNEEVNVELTALKSKTQVLIDSISRLRDEYYHIVEPDLIRSFDDILTTYRQGSEGL